MACPSRIARITFVPGGAPFVIRPDRRQLPDTGTLAGQASSLAPLTRHAVATIADRLRRLPCADGIVAMDLHRIGCELERIAVAAGPVERPVMAAGNAALVLGVE